jgi:hypothetical protein
VLVNLVPGLDKPLRHALAGDGIVVYHDDGETVGVRFRR